MNAASSPASSMQAFSLKYVIVEVKADNQIEDAVVQAKKEFAQQMAVASGMEYRIMKSSDADNRRYRMLL